MWCLSGKESVKMNPRRFGWVGMTWLVLPVLLVLVVGSHVQGETVPTKKWTMRYDGPLHQDSFSYEYSTLLLALFPFVEPSFKLMAVDANGDMYITGTTITEKLYDIVTIKINKADGSIAWKTIYDGGHSYSEYPAGIALDKDGDVYVTGVTGTENVTSDIVTIKYNGTKGNIVWDQTYAGDSDFLDGATGIAVDSQKNVYVCGFTGYTDKIMNTKIPRFDYLTLKYNGSGVFQWAKTYNGPDNLWDVATAITIGPGKNVYVTGASLSVKTQVDIATIKYSPGGKKVWAKIYDGPGHTFDVGRAIAVNASGNTYVTGESSIDGIQALVTMKYDDVATNNLPLWAKHYKDPKGNSFSWGRALELDVNGAPHATGDLQGSAGIDYLTIKYSPGTGKQTWAKTYNGPATDGNDQVRSIALDSVGNVYVTGSSMGSAGNDDIATVKYAAANGAKCWVVRYDNKPAMDYDGGVAVAVYGDKTVYVAGESTGKSTDLDMVVIRYNQAP